MHKYILITPLAFLMSFPIVIILAFRWKSTSTSDIIAFYQPAESVAAITGVRSNTSMIF